MCVFVWNTIKNKQTALSPAHNEILFWMKKLSSILTEKSQTGSWEHGVPLPPCGNALIHHHCRQAAKPLVLILNVARLDNTESFYHLTEVLTMFLQRFMCYLAQSRLSSPRQLTGWSWAAWRWNGHWTPWKTVCWGETFHWRQSTAPCSGRAAWRTPMPELPAASWRRSPTALRQSTGRAPRLSVPPPGWRDSRGGGECEKVSGHLPTFSPSPHLPRELLRQGVTRGWLVSKWETLDWVWTHKDTHNIALLFIF